MKFTISVALFTSLASLSQGIVLARDQADGIYIGSYEDVDTSNHTRIGDIGDSDLAKLLIRSAKFPRSSSLPLGSTNNCWEGGSLDAMAVASARTTMANVCKMHTDKSDWEWVKAKSTVYAVSGDIASFFCNYGSKSNEGTYCTYDGVTTHGTEASKACDGSPSKQEISETAFLSCSNFIR